MDTVPTSVVTYDHYALREGGKTPFVYRDDFFSNLEVFRRVSLEKGIDWGIIVQVAAWHTRNPPDENALRWQAFNSLVYGARSLGWYTYLTEIEHDNLNWNNAVIRRTVLAARTIRSFAD